MLCKQVLGKVGVEPKKHKKHRIQEGKMNSRTQVCQQVTR